MSIHAIWLNSNPELEAPLRRANEARAAAFYAVWKATARAVGNATREVIDRIRRAQRSRITYRELNALSDHHLGDIGLSRSEISDIAEMVADSPPDVGLTLADLRQARSDRAAEGAPRTEPRRQHSRRQDVPHHLGVRRPNKPSAVTEQAAA